MLFSFNCKKKKKRRKKIKWVEAFLFRWCLCQKREYLSSREVMGVSNRFTYIWLYRTYILLNSIRSLLFRQTRHLTILCLFAKHVIYQLPNGGAWYDYSDRKPDIQSYCHVWGRNEPRHDKTNKVTVRPAKTDQPGHSPSLIRVFAVRMKKAWVLSYPLSAQQRLWSDWADAQADLNLRWAHSHFVGFVMSWLKFCKTTIRLCCRSEFLSQKKTLIFLSCTGFTGYTRILTSGETLRVQLSAQPNLFLRF